MKHLLLTTIAAVVLVTTAFAGPIHDAAMNGNLAGVQAELDKGVDVNADRGGGWTPLPLAALYDYKEIAELLITAGADVNAKTKQYGSTPLRNAAYRHHNEIVELLIGKGADLNAKRNINVNGKDRLGLTPLDHALTRRLWDTADVLRKHGGRTGTEDIAYQFESLNKILTLLQHLIIRDDVGVDPDKPSIEKLQGVFVIRGKIGGIYEVQYHTGDNDWLVREVVTLQANRQLYIDSSSYDEKRFYRVKLIE